MKKITIFDVVADCKALKSLIDEQTDEETGEAKELSEQEKADFLSWINETEQNLETKFDNLYKVFRNFKAIADIAEAEKNALKAEVERLSKRAKARENDAGRVKGLIEFAMVNLGFKKYKTALFSVGFQATKKWARPVKGFFDPDLIPVEFLVRELSATAIDKAIADGRLYTKEDHYAQLFYLDREGEEQTLKNVTYTGSEAMVIR
jgi:hypothetical protein